MNELREEAERPRAEDGHHPRVQPRRLLADAVEDPLVIPYTELSGFPVPKISGHAGKLFVGKLGGQEVAVLAGRAHPYEVGNAAVMRPAIEMLKGAGIETLILTNAAGSLKPEMRPGSIMLIADHINYSGMNPLIGQHGDENFVPMTDAYDPALRARLQAAAKASRCRRCIRASTAGTRARPSRRQPKSACSRSSAARRSACRRCFGDRFKSVRQGTEGRQQFLYEFMIDRKAGYRKGRGRIRRIFHSARQAEAFRRFSLTSSAENFIQRLPGR